MTDPRELLLLYAGEGNADLLKGVVEGQSTWLLRDAFETSASYGHLNCVTLLEPLLHTHMEHGRALRDATLNGHAHVVSYLLNRNFKVDDELIDAFQNQQWECAKELMPYCSNEHFAEAVMALFEWDSNGVDNPSFFHTVWMLLLEFRGAEQLLEDIAWEADCLWYQDAHSFLEKQIANEQKARIEQHMSPTPITQRARKI